MIESDSQSSLEHVELLKVSKSNQNVEKQFSRSPTKLSQASYHWFDLLIKLAASS